jgi:RNA polymerase sigma-70 factor (ECF subfamily)
MFRSSLASTLQVDARLRSLSLDGAPVSTSRPHEITELLQRWRSGDERASETLLSLIYSELHRLAKAYMRRERRDHTLQTTALINEAFLRLAGQRRMDWQSRAQFFGIAAQFMRRILVDHARHHRYAKRGGPDLRVVPVEEAVLFAPERAPAVLALDAALTRLGEVDERKARIVELRYFGGLTVEETAGLLGIAPITVMRDWSFAKAWLRRELSGDG